MEESQEPRHDLIEQLPVDIQLTVKSLRVFGHLDDVAFTELYRHVETIQLGEGQYLFRVGDADDCMYIVQSGRVSRHSTPCFINHFPISLSLMTPP